MKTSEASFFSLIFPNLIKKGIIPCLIGYIFEYTLLCTAYYMKRAIDLKSSPEEILEKFLSY